MKLGKLLFAGKSVVNGSTTVSYRENKQVALPRFISPKNPFAPCKTPPEIAPEPAQKPAPVAGPSKSLVAWTNKLTPASFWGGSTPAEPKVLPAVQAELSLDAVKVIHNDLSDADVDVVPIKSRPAASQENTLSPPKRSWEVFGERLMRATLF